MLGPASGGSGSWVTFASTAPPVRPTQARIKRSGLRPLTPRTPVPRAGVRGRDKTVQRSALNCWHSSGRLLGGRDGSGGASHLGLVACRVVRQCLSSGGSAMVPPLRGWWHQWHHCPEVPWHLDGTPMALWHYHAGRGAVLPLGLHHQAPRQQQLSGAVEADVRDAAALFPFRAGATFGRRDGLK